MKIILGFFGKFTAIISSIPWAVLGGVTLLLYGFISVNGLKVLIENQTDFSKTKNVVVASAMLVLGLGGAAISYKQNYGVPMSSQTTRKAIDNIITGSLIGTMIGLASAIPNRESKSYEAYKEQQNKKGA